MYKFQNQSSHEYTHMFLLELTIYHLRDQYNIKYLKLCGAGGGGYFLIMSEDNIPEAIKINIDNKGVIVWKI